MIVLLVYGEKQWNVNLYGTRINKMFKRKIGIGFLT